MTRRGEAAPRRPDGRTTKAGSSVLRGNHPARVDDKGRLKIPNGFRVLVEQQYGAELFVTSVSGEYVRIYPMAVWLEIERRLADGPSSNPFKQRLLGRGDFFRPTRT